MIKHRGTDFFMMLMTGILHTNMPCMNMAHPLDYKAVKKRLLISFFCYVVCCWSKTFVNHLIIGIATFPAAHVRFLCLVWFLCLSIVHSMFSFGLCECVPVCLAPLHVFHFCVLLLSVPLCLAPPAFCSVPNRLLFSPALFCPWPLFVNQLLSI